MSNGSIPPHDGYNEDQFLPISGLQHLLFCERQCALIHIERLWAENRFTAEGRILHSRTDDAGESTVRGQRVVRAMHIWSNSLGLYGICDVVEFRSNIPVPIEYKRGKPKDHRADEVQLCAQAICLEEIFGVQISQADLFYGETRRRQPVTLDQELRDITSSLAARFHAMLETRDTPPPAYQARKCGACSLSELCMPRSLERRRTAAQYLNDEASTELDDISEGAP